MCILVNPIIMNPSYQIECFFQPQVKPNPERERKIKHDLLDNADVIAGTLSGFGGSVLRQYLEGRERQRRGGFDCLIIDEVNIGPDEETY